MINKILTATVKKADAEIETTVNIVKHVDETIHVCEDHPDIMKTVEDELNKIGHYVKSNQLQ